MGPSIEVAVCFGRRAVVKTQCIYEGCTQKKKQQQKITASQLDRLA